jgi:ketosteroid isomerase-like protein
VTDPRALVRVVVEECWPGLDGLDRLEALVAPGYVHHTPFGDLTFEQFRAGLAYVESVFTDRAYRVEHVVVEGDLAAAYVSWTATRVADGSRVEGRGAYHCRVAGGLVAEDWDVFYPTS